MSGSAVSSGGSTRAGTRIWRPPYDQLLKYRESLENPPLLVVCDMDRLVVHTNFTGTRTEIHDIPLAKLAEPQNFEILRAEADLLLRRFWERLGQVKVLDPACGSGNFLYVTLQKLKDLEKGVILYGMEHGFPAFIPHVGPWQFYGIEINPYAFELAQMSVWIGYLQWIKQNGFGEPEEPVLRPMDNFECKDAILDLSNPENLREPEWPKVDFIVGNPPFLGGKKMRRELGDQYRDSLFQLWKGRVPAEADLCCYWFEKARRQIQEDRCQRAGLLATQAIRGGANRQVLERVKETGDIFFAIGDKNWILNGASVHVSLVGFDGGLEDQKQLDGRSVEQIHPNLTFSSNLTVATPLQENFGISFMGDTKGGAFTTPFSEANDLLT